MRRVVVETIIHAPRELVFDARSVGLRHVGATATYDIRPFGIPTRFTVTVTEMDRPSRYVDEASHPAFKKLRHVHEFEEVEGGTLMRDVLEYQSPFGIFAGWFLRRFVTKRVDQLFPHFTHRSVMSK